MLRFSYVLDGAGWATATLGDGRHEVVMTTSYLHDSLRDLARAAIAIRDGSAEASAIFMAEPGEHQLHVRRTTGNAVQLEVRWFKDWASHGIYPSHRFETVFRTTCDAEHVVICVFSVLDHILNEWGPDGYKQRWIEHPFPIDLYRTLASG